MPLVAVTMPQLGESIAEATIIRLDVAIGSEVQADQEIIEVETNKATMGVTTLCGGVVKELFAEEGETYAVGTILGLLEATAEEVERTGVTVHGDESAATPVEEEVNRPHDYRPGTEEESYTPPKVEVEPSVQGLKVPAGGLQGAHYISPRMRARMNELGLQGADVSAIAGSGAGGRVTVEDLESFLSYIEGWPGTKASPMRLAVADAMRRSWTRPLATVGMEAPLEKLVAYRKTLDPKPGLTLFLLRAFGLALKEHPATAGFLVGQKVVHPKAYDIGVAVQVEDGVVVPVVRNVDQRSVSELSADYENLVVQSRDKKVPEEAVGGGIATVTNFGTFGLRWATPVPLPSETLILGMGSGEKRPVWDEAAGQFVPVLEAELTLTFDHRVVDGGGAGVLLRRVVELLQNPEDL
ncbi:dihydrolipoamide acetyltransferase family protein [Roseibacillus persicicus]|uniref:Dihydrolipoamide acetyltransferase component of pyruvate dehydrogenase complex n=1 Tax=Roseibacillus persicicus TaxID=454148 RepID=A0A918TC92_9BACT|nr:dihydrolipoamide acetyltransferase family protein [Roseibacillus persicicus]GHC40924.1 dihydrolipoamide acetyltransferase component of pyruvate dehydrogenase complex [Roseibacillus persicicus]